MQKVVYKLLTCIILMNILFQFNYSSIIYAVTSATTVTQSTTSGTTASTTEETIDPDQDVTNADDDNLGADINDDSGTLLGPLVEIVRAIGDAIMSILTKCMLGTSFESMMVSWDEVDNSKLSEANTSKTYTESEINEFKNAFDNLPDLKYPNFKYTPEEIFKGEIDVFGIDFIGGNTVKNGEVKQNESTGWNSLRKMVSTWYQVLRYIAVIGLLSILIYLGIKIILSSSAGKKAEYKSALINWIIAMFLLFFMHYIMAFIIVLIQKFTTLLGKSIGNIKVTFGDKTFITNFMGLARFQAQENSLTNQLGYVIIYIAFITLTFKFTFIYFKRMLKMAILTIVAPLVAMMYPLDKKGGGKARGFDFWLKEYIYTALLQPVHLLLYNLLIGTAVQISVKNPIYAIIALFFMANAEKMFKKIFGFGRAGKGMENGLEKTVGAAAMTSAVMNGAKRMFAPPLAPKIKETSKNGSDDKNNLNTDTDDDDQWDDDDEEEVAPESLLLDKGIFKTRESLANEEFKKEREQTKSFEEAFNKLKQDGLIEGKGHNSPYNRVTEGRFKILRAAIKANEDPFEKNNIPLQYNDEYSHLNSNQLLDKMRWHLERGEIDEAQKYYNVLHKRILQNKYIRNHGNPQAFLERPYSNLSDEQLKLQYEMAKKANNKEEMRKYEEEMELRNKAKGQVHQQTVTNQNTNENMNNTDENNTETNPENEEKQLDEKQTKKNEYKDRGTLDRFRRGTISGVKALGKKAIKPVWNLDKTAGENVQELLTDKVLKGAVQATVGVTAAAVQAGVSLTDGKYTAKEAIGSLAGGIALGGKVYKSGKKFAKGVAREVNYGSSDDERKNRIAKDWSERDDVQDEFKNTYGAKSDEMIRRAKHIVVKSAIQDVNEQKKIFRYSNYLRKHNSSYSIEEADKKALEVYKYKNRLESRNELDRVINDKSAREEIADKAVQNNRSSKSSDLVRKNCLDMIESAVEFNNVQENSELDIFGGE